MKPTLVDLFQLRERVDELGPALCEAWEIAGRDSAGNETPDLLSDALAQLLDILERLVAQSLAEPVTTTEINTLGEYGLHLFEQLATLAERVEQAAIARDFEFMCLPFALWIARHGGELRTIEPVVNAIAQQANQPTEPSAMARLHSQCCELIDATSPSLQESFNGESDHPWRMLVLNRAIVATRSHKPDLISTAYDAVIDLLPVDASEFFTEAMEQMALLEYPDHVRDIVRRYYTTHAKPRRLH